MVSGSRCRANDRSVRDLPLLLVVPAVLARTLLRPCGRNWSQAPGQAFPRADAAAGAAGEPDIGPRAAGPPVRRGLGRAGRQGISLDVRSGWKPDLEREGLLKGATKAPASALMAHCNQYAGNAFGLPRRDRALPGGGGSPAPGEPRRVNSDSQTSIARCI